MRVSSNDLFRVTTIRLRGTFRAEDAERIQEAFRKARGTDLLVIDVREAQLLDPSLLRPAREANRPQVRIIGDEDPSRQTSARVQTVATVSFPAPAKISGVQWEEFVVEQPGPTGRSE